MKHPFLIPVLMAVACTTAISSFAQSANPDTAGVVLRDSISKEERDHLIAIAKGNEKTGVYSKVEIESEFPGGARAWINFLNSHLTYPSKAVRKRIEGQ